MREALRRAIIWQTLRGLRRVYGVRPAPLRLLRLIHIALARGNGDLVEVLTRRDPPHDQWALHPGAVRFLERELERLAPRHVLEFGSGVSTLWIARAMDRAHGDGLPHVFSIEQDETWAMKVRGSLAQAGMSETAHVIVAPLERQKIWGVETLCYSVSEDVLHDVLGSARPDFLLIDGPSGEPGSRFGTLPLVTAFVASHASFFLDDALRRSELETGLAWLASGRIRVDGVRLVGRGILSGSLGMRAT